MKKLLLPLMTLLLIFSCDTSTVFKTTLPYLKETTSSFPEAINGTYFFMNDSLKTAFLNSGLPAPQFIENLCNIDSTEYAHFAHSISISEDRRQLYNTLLVLITEKVLNLNYFLDDKDTVRWRKIHEHLMELQMKNEASETDTTYLLPIWKKEGLYFTNYFSLENDKTSDKYEGYILRNEFDRSPEESQSDNAIKPAIVKSYNDQYYLIEQQDSLYRITQYALSPWGFTKSIIPPINLPSENTDSSGKLETSIVDSIQKTSRVSQIGDQIVFDPQKEELERLFNSSWAKKEYYIRIDQQMDATTSYLKENGLTALLSILCLVLLILLLLKKSPKKMA